MVKPQYSLSFIFKVVAVMAIPSLIAGRAAQGSEWAVGICIGMVAAVVACIVLLAISAASYSLLQLLAGVVTGGPRPLEVVPLEPPSINPPPIPPA